MHISPLFGTPFPRALYFFRLIISDNQGYTKPILELNARYAVKYDTFLNMLA